MSNERGTLVNPLALCLGGWSMGQTLMFEAGTAQRISRTLVHVGVRMAPSVWEAATGVWGEGPVCHPPTRVRCSALHMHTQRDAVVSTYRALHGLKGIALTLLWVCALLRHAVPCCAVLGLGHYVPVAFGSAAEGSR